ncbi:MAG: type II toxin-antitoxin system VapC family toxin [Phycisphaeraceae bacterium]
MSYLTAWPSRDLIMAANQQVTHDWWNTRRHGYDLFISQLVLVESAGGDPDAAARRLKAMEGIPSVAAPANAMKIARSLMKSVPLPSKAEADATHLAIAAANGMDFFLTWNCRHLANATLYRGIESTCAYWGHKAPTICTPLQLIGDRP